MYTYFLSSQIQNIQQQYKKIQLYLFVNAKKLLHWSKVSKQQPFQNQGKVASLSTSSVEFLQLRSLGYLWEYNTFSPYNHLLSDKPCNNKSIQIYELPALFSPYDQLNSDWPQSTQPEHLKSIQIYEFPGLFSPCDQLHSFGPNYIKSIQILPEWAWQNKVNLEKNNLKVLTEWGEKNNTVSQ